MLTRFRSLLLSLLRDEQHVYRPSTEAERAECLERRNHLSVCHYYWRKGRDQSGQEIYLDPRDSDLQARGMVLYWQRRVLENQARRAERKFHQHISRIREQAQREWRGMATVTHISEARR